MYFRNVKPALHPIILALPAVLALLPLSLLPAPLYAGEVNAVIADSVSVYQFARDPGGIRYVGKFLTDQQYVMAMRPNAGYLWKTIADGLARMKKDGFLAELQTQWF